MPTKRLEKCRKAGRPSTLTMPEPIPDTPENIAKAVLNTPPKKRHEWKFVQEHEQPYRRAGVQEGKV